MKFLHLKRVLIREKFTSDNDRDLRARVSRARSSFRVGGHILVPSLTRMRCTAHQGRDKTIRGRDEVRCQVSSVRP
jgi:hypothetical protein